jgi:hypothetical protein
MIEKEKEQEEETTPKDFVDTSYLRFPLGTASRPWTSNLLVLLR